MINRCVVMALLLPLLAACTLAPVQHEQLRSGPEVGVVANYATVTPFDRTGTAASPAG